MYRPFLLSNSLVFIIATSLIPQISVNVKIAPPPTGCETYYNSIVSPDAVKFVSQLCNEFQEDVNSVSMSCTWTQLVLKIIRNINLFSRIALKDIFVKLESRD